MNRRQKKAREWRFKNREKLLAERERVRLERLREAAAKAGHRKMVLAKWAERKHYRHTREMNTPKTATGEW